MKAPDNGKPLNIAKGADVPLAVDLLRYGGMGDQNRRQQFIPSRFPTPGREISGVQRLREPVGVARQIIPWNFLLLMAAWKLGPARHWLARLF